MQIVPPTPADAPAVEALLDAAFGTTRQTRTAYRLREAAVPVAALSRIVRGDDGRLLATIQYWPIALDSGDRRDALTLLGPVAVQPELRGQGIGVALIERTLGLADTLGHDAILLIGDLDYYSRFGFDAARTQGWTLPGPVERARLLLRGGHGLPAVARVEAAGMRLDA